MNYKLWINGSLTKTIFHTIASGYKPSIRPVREASAVQNDNDGKWDIASMSHFDDPMLHKALDRLMERNHL